MIRREVIAIILLIAVFVVVGSGSLDRFFTPECSLGVYGSSATVTFRGSGAPQVCEQFITHDIVTAGRPGSWYLVNDSLGDTMACEGTMPTGQHYVVRDEGAIAVGGLELCRVFQ